jgi:hypothetical protein
MFTNEILPRNHLASSATQTPGPSPWSALLVAQWGDQLAGLGLKIAALRRFAQPLRGPLLDGFAKNDPPVFGQMISC